jgi:hypothetical protein
MGTGERHVSRRVPVLRDDNVPELAIQTVDEWHGLGAAFHWQRSDIDEAILHVHDDQCRLTAGLDVLPDGVDAAKTVRLARPKKWARPSAAVDFISVLRSFSPAAHPLFD